MYLKKIGLQNYRKYNINKKEAFFASPKLEASLEIEKRISASTTLILGTNNSGKTTIIKALKLLANKGGEIKYSDFNLCYLEKSLRENTLPTLEFELEIELNNENQEIQKIIPFLIRDEQKEIKLLIRYTPKDKELFLGSIKTLEKKGISSSLKNKKYYKLINETKFEKQVFLDYDENKKVEKHELEKLINIKFLEAGERVTGEKLSEIYNRIFTTAYIKEKFKGSELDKFEKDLHEKGEEIGGILSGKLGGRIKKVSQIMDEHTNSEIKLDCDFNLERVFEDVINYEYVTGDKSIPPEQFGLGYTNLMRIIGEILEYIEREYKENEGTIELICIEEPEAYMHPELQKVFIQNISSILEELLGKESNKLKNLQIIITSHSPSILESKLKMGNTFDKINYLRGDDIVYLEDEKIISHTKAQEKEIEKSSEEEREGQELKAQLEYIAKRISVEYSNLFFSEAVIIVEGISELNLMNNFLEIEGLNLKNIAILNINGAHAHMYFKLLDCLNIPSLIITDLDLKKCEGSEDCKNKQVTTLENRETTNNVLKALLAEKPLVKFNDVKEQGRKIVVTQNEKIEGYYATSLEEALILSNYNSETFQTTLKKAKPNLRGELKDTSRKIQKSFSSSEKSSFSALLDYELSVNETFKSEFQIPKYIKEGFEYLKKELKGEKNV